MLGTLRSDVDAIVAVVLAGENHWRTIVPHSFDIAYPQIVAGDGESSVAAWPPEVGFRFEEWSDDDDESEPKIIGGPLSSIRAIQLTRASSLAPEVA